MERKLLRTDYKDSVFEGLRKYRKIDNGDGTVSFVDVTDYTVKEESFFGAEDANAINEAINALNENALLKYEYENKTGTGGFLKLATFKVTKDGLECPIEFYLTETAYAGNIFLRFAKDGDEYILAEFTYNGNIDMLNPRMHKSADDTWDLYVWLRGWSAISVSGLKINAYTIQRLNNGHGIVWNYGSQNIFPKYPSGTVAPTLMTCNIQLKDIESLWTEIYNLKSQTALKKWIKQVEFTFNNSSSSTMVAVNDVLAGSALDINAITLQGLICTGIGGILSAGFTGDKNYIAANTAGTYTGKIKANIILLYEEAISVSPDQITGGEVPGTRV